MATESDILIIGAGPAGLSFARSLANLPIRVTMIERSSQSVLQDPPEDGREIALTHLSVNLMQESGAWEKLPEEGVSPIERARVFDGDSDYSLDFDRQTSNLDALGYLVPNHLIRKACYEVIEGQENLTLLTETSVEHVYTDEEYGYVQLNNGSELRARLVVAADTRFSESRRKMGVSASMRDFSRSAIVCRMEHSRSHEQTAFECFHYGRTTAILPMNGNRSSVVVTVNSRDASKFAECPESEFNRDIEKQLGGLLGEMSLIGSRHVYPLVAVHANQFVSNRFALIGDAAVGMHPVTAHGFNLGLRGQAFLASEITKAIDAGRDVGAEDVLKGYEAKHMKVTRVLYHGTNLVVGLFTNESMAARLARKATLHVANNLSPVKKLITNSLTEESLSSAELPIPGFFSKLPGAVSGLASLKQKGGELIRGFPDPLGIRK